MVKRIAVMTVILLGMLVAQIVADLNADERFKIERLSRMLMLTPDQKAKVTAEREKSFHKLQALERKWHRLCKKMRLEVEKEVPDKGTIVKISREMGNIQGRMVSLRTSSLLYLKSILTQRQISIVRQGHASE